MPSRFAEAGIAALLVLGGAAMDAKAAPGASQEPAIAVACEAPAGPVDRPDYCSYPTDVRNFIDGRDACDHWRGEPVPEREDDPDGVRGKQIIDAVNESCTGTDKRLATLRATYAEDPRILELLEEFEPDVESDD